jgi:hypothetical protein
VRVAFHRRLDGMSSSDCALAKARLKENLMTQKMNVTPGMAAGGDGSRPGASATNIVADVTADAKEIAGEAAGKAKEIAESQLALRKDKALETLGHVAQALRETGGRLGSQKEPIATDYVMRAADGIDGVGRYLRSRDLRGLVEDVESFARREPAVFLGGAFVAGRIGSRFLKSSKTPLRIADGNVAQNGERSGKASGGGWPKEGPSGMRPRASVATTAGRPPGQGLPSSSSQAPQSPSQVAAQSPGQPKPPGAPSPTAGSGSPQGNRG